MLAPHRGNHLLERLSGPDYERLAERMERVTLTPSETICRPGEPMRYAVFPLTGVLAALVPVESGTAVEVAGIGCDGVAGASLLVDEHAVPYHVSVQVKGDALRIPAAHFRQILSENPAVRDVTQRFWLTVTRQIAQNAACNVSHPIPQRVARWLLATADRAASDEFEITQETLAERLGVRRQSVSDAARAFQQDGRIAYRRGRLRIIERAGLERSACGCYQAVRQAYERLLRPWT